MRSKYHMYYGASKKIIERAKELRLKQTDAEKLLWTKLKNRYLSGYKFRRQHPVFQYVVDFYCHEKQLVIEVDGKIHLKPEVGESDYNRSYEIEKFGIRILRFTNEEVENKIDSVVKKIEDALNSTPNP